MSRFTGLRRAGRAARAIRRHGPGRLLRCHAERAVLGLLRRHYGFDRWHADAPYPCRPYKRVVTGLVNGLSPSVVVEVGVGLGDILSRVRAPVRVGYDTDATVLRAARRLHGRSIAFRVGGPDDVSEDQIDVLVMVNWIHNLAPDELDAALRPLVGRSSWLVLDAVDPTASGTWRHRHDFAFLEPIADRRSVIPVASEQRSLHVFRVRAAVGRSA